MKMAMHFFYYLLVALQFISGVLLIYVVTIQESKNDGLTGQIGSTTTSAFKGKAGREERLNQLTRNVGFVFFAISLLVAIGTGRWNI